MSLSKFLQIASCIHMCNNVGLELQKMTKVLLVYDLSNVTVKKFGVMHQVQPNSILAGTLGRIYP